MGDFVCVYVWQCIVTERSSIHTTTVLLLQLHHLQRFLPTPLSADLHLQAFDDCTTISITFKLLDSFEGLLDREVIAADLERKHTDLLASYGSDLKVSSLHSGPESRAGFTICSHALEVKRCHMVAARARLEVRFR